MDVKGTFVSQTRITCISPNFTETGITPGTVDVRVCLAGESFTTTKADFTFFPVTDANFCFMYGPGLLEEGAPGRETTFVIQVNDHDLVLSATRSPLAPMNRITVLSFFSPAHPTAAPPRLFVDSCSDRMLCTLPRNQARDGDNNNREFGGDEFDVCVFFLMSEDYGEEEPAADAEGDDDESSTGGRGENRSRIMVRECSSVGT